MDNKSLYNSLIKGRKGWMILCVLLVFGMMYILNYNYPLFLDDYVYSFIYLSDKRVESVTDILESQYIHYFAHGGRNVVHFICQFLLMLNFSWTSILNTAAYVVFIYLIYLIVNKKNKLNPVLFFLCHVLVWFLQPGFCQAVLWKTGSANYLWGMLIVLMFIYPYYNYYRNSNTSNNIFKVVLFLFAGIIAGWTNENISIALISYIVGLILLLKIEKIVIPKWTISGLIGVIMGCAIMFLAPGNYERMSFLREYVEAHGSSMKDLYIYNIKSLLNYSLFTILPLIVLYIGGFIILNRQNKDVWKDNKVIISSLLFIVAGFVAFFGLLASPTSDARALFGTIILFIIPVVLIYANIDFNLKRIFYIFNLIVLVGLFCLYIIDYNWKNKTIKIASDIWKERFILMDEYKSRGLDTITFTKRIQVHVKYGIWDLNDSINENCARYYNFKSMKVIDPPKVENN